MATTNKAGTKIYETIDQAIIGRHICIEPSGREDGSGTRKGVIRSKIFQAAMRNKGYMDKNSNTIFTPRNKIYIKPKGSSKQMEQIIPDSKTFLNRIQNFCGKHREREIELVVSIGKKRQSSDDSYSDIDYEYLSDYSENVREGNSSEISPQKLLDVTTSNSRRNQIATISFESASGKFMKNYIMIKIHHYTKVSLMSIL